MIFAALGLLVSANASAHAIDLSFRAEALPGMFARQQGVGFGSEWRITDAFGIDLVGSWLPDLSRNDWKDISQQQPPQVPLYDVSKTRMSGTARFVLAPLSAQVQVGHGAPTEVRPYLAVGGGGVHTVDDLAAFGLQDDPAAIATERQNHATVDLALGLRAQLAARGFVGAELSRSRFVEELQDQRIGQRDVAVSLVVGFTPGGHARRDARVDENGDRKQPIED